MGQFIGEIYCNANFLRNFFLSLGEKLLTHVGFGWSWFTSSFHVRTDALANSIPQAFLIATIQEFVVARVELRLQFQSFGQRTSSYLGP